MKHWTCIFIYILTVLSALLRAFQGIWLETLYALAALILYWVLEKGTVKLHLTLSDFLKTIMTIFFFAAIILGSVFGFYSRFSWWDSLLHGTTGLLMAIVGLNLPEIFHIDISKKHFFKILIALSFSMMIGVFWEFYEYGADHLLNMNTQKDTLVTTLTSNYIHDSDLSQPQTIRNIEKTVIYHDTDHVTVIEGGMLDIGLTDTLKDQAVHLGGTLIMFLLYGLALKNPNKTALIKLFMIKRSN